MASINNLKNSVLSIIGKIKNSIEQQNPDKEILLIISKLKNSIFSENNAIESLTKYKRMIALTIFYTLCEFEHLIYRYNSFIEYNMPKEAKNESVKLLNLLSDLDYRYNKVLLNNTDNMEQKMLEVMDLLQSHINSTGRTQSIKDLQRGLNILNKNRRQSPIKEKILLDEDGIFGNKTFACFNSICKNYTPRIIVKYIKKGAINNAIFSTKNNPKINTNELINNICNNFKLKEAK